MRKSDLPKDGECKTSQRPARCSPTLDAALAPRLPRGRPPHVGLLPGAHGAAVSRGKVRHAGLVPMHSIPRSMPPAHFYPIPRIMPPAHFYPAGGTMTQASSPSPDGTNNWIDHPSWSMSIPGLVGNLPRTTAHGPLSWPDTASPTTQSVMRGVASAFVWTSAAVARGLPGLTSYAAGGRAARPAWEDLPAAAAAAAAVPSAPALLLRSWAPHAQGPVSFGQLRHNVPTVSSYGHPQQQRAQGDYQNVVPNRGYGNHRAYGCANVDSNQRYLFVHGLPSGSPPYRSPRPFHPSPSPNGWRQGRA